MLAATSPRVRFGATLLLIFVGTLMPGDWMRGAEGLLRPGLPWPELGHFVLFALLASSPLFGPGWRGALRAMACALVVALSTELLQAWVPGRQPSVADALLDLAGAGVGRLLWRRLQPI